MILNLLYTLVRFVLDPLLVRGRPESYLRVEVLALRHQLRVLERKRRRPRWQPADRLLLASFGRILRGSGSSSLLPSPETLLRWHRELVRRKWAAFGKRPRRRRPGSGELHQLIVRLAR
jgi:putative transposase